LLSPISDTSSDHSTGMGKRPHKKKSIDPEFVSSVRGYRNSLSALASKYDHPSSVLPPLKPSGLNKSLDTVSKPSIDPDSESVVSALPPLSAYAPSGLWKPRKRPSWMKEDNSAASSATGNRNKKKRPKKYLSKQTKTKKTHDSDSSALPENGYYYDFENFYCLLLERIFYIINLLLV